MRLELKPHPASLPRGIKSVDAEVSRDKSRLSLYWRVAGDLDRLLLPKPTEPRRANDLWKHTCFEVFLRVGEGPEYIEVNFSPSGEWAVYRFNNRREGMADVAEQLHPGLQSRFHGGCYKAYASIDLSKLAFADAPLWRAAVTAVIEERDERKSYWAIEHPSREPDFHDPAGFLLDLPRSHKK